MTKISNETAYPSDEIISDLDYLAGTNGDLTSKPTKTFSLGKLRSYVLSGLSPLTGGTMRISEFVYNGVLTTPQDVVNAITPTIEIRQYEIFIVNVNGNKYILRLQDVIIGEDETLTVSSDFINIQGLQGIAGVGITSVTKTGTSGLVDTYTITFTNGTTTTYNVTNGADGADGDDAPAVNDYKVYTATLSQSGTNAPIVALVLKNTIPGTITFSRGAVGVYEANFSIPFDSAKAIIILTNGDPNGNVGAQSGGNTVFSLETRTNAGVSSDGILYNAVVEIRIYN